MHSRINMTSRSNTFSALYDMTMIRHEIIMMQTLHGDFVRACLQDPLLLGGNVIMCIHHLLYSLRRLCDLLQINMEWAVRRKIALNERKYHEDDVKDGCCTKYTAYSAKTGITSTKGQSTIDLLKPDEAITPEENCNFDIVVHHIAKELDGFNHRRGWEKTHTSRNIMLCLAGEIGELSSIFQWYPDIKTKLDKTTIDCASQEIADVCIYILNFVAAKKLKLFACTNE